MRTKVKTIWGSGLCSVHEKFVREALRASEDLIIECNGAEMVVPYEKLKEMKPRSKQFKDKYSNEYYTLYDFWWKATEPEVKQEQLL